MVTSNRSINTGHAPEQRGMTLEAVKAVKIGGHELKEGETIEVTRSEARRILAITKSVRIKVD